MKTLKKIAAVAAIVLGLGMVVSCGMMPTELIDADFVKNEKDCSWAEGTWDVSYTNSYDYSIYCPVVGHYIYDGDEYKLTVNDGTTFVAYLAGLNLTYKFEAYVSPNRKMLQWTRYTSDGSEYIIGTAAKL